MARLGDAGSAHSTASGADAPAPHIYICGAGVRLPGQLTIETVDVLQQCTLIFSIFKPSLRDRLPLALRTRFRSLWSQYRPGELRSRAYDAIVETVLAAASHDGPVAYLTQGNPIFFDSVTQGIVSRGAQRGLVVDLRAAVSALDTILIDLRQDIAPGLQIYDASAVVGHDIALRPDIPCLLLQPNVFGTLYVAAEQRPLAEALRPLREHLLRFYPPEHLLVYVTSATTACAGPTIDRFTLRELGGTAAMPQVPGASLFIPPAQPLAVNARFLDEMLDPARLAEPFRRDHPSREREGRR